MKNTNFQIATTGASTKEGSADSFYVTVHAVAKTNGPQAPYCLANELICAQIARVILLPVPPSGLVSSKVMPGGVYFASWNFNSDNNALPPADPKQCWSLLPDLSTGLVLFDALVANNDRHRKNLSLDGYAKPPVMNVFDHSHALFGPSQGMATAKFALLKDRLAITGGPYTSGNRHCLLDALGNDNHFDKWLSRIQQIPDFVIREVCDQTENLGPTIVERAAARDFLLHRRDNLGLIIDAHRNEFQAIAQWSLTHANP